MKDSYVREGATFEETFTDTDVTASTLTLTISNTGGTILFEKTENYVVEGEEAIATISFEVDLPVETYQYMYTITYDDGFVVKLPDPEGCEDESCDLPLFVVCNANDIEGS